MAGIARKAACLHGRLSLDTKQDSSFRGPASPGSNPPLATSPSVYRSPSFSDFSMSASDDGMVPAAHFGFLRAWCLCREGSTCARSD